MFEMCSVKGTDCMGSSSIKGIDHFPLSCGSNSMYLHDSSIVLRLDNFVESTFDPPPQCVKLCGSVAYFRCTKCLQKVCHCCSVHCPKCCRYKCISCDCICDSIRCDSIRFEIRTGQDSKEIHRGPIRLRFDLV